MTATDTPSNAVPKEATVPPLLHFAGGLPPFADAREFALVVEPDAPPFLRMECVNKDLAYVLIDPFALEKDYRPQFSDADFRAVGLGADGKPLVLAIVNFSRGMKEATANLAGPLLVNPATGKARQVVLENAATYSARHRLLKD